MHGFTPLSFLAVLWGIAIGVNHSRRTDITVVPFVVVEILVALGFPFFLFVATVLMANVLDFITYGMVDARKVLPRLLRGIKFEKGTDIAKQERAAQETEGVDGGRTIHKNKKDYDFWVIEDTFYFYLDKREMDDRQNKGFCFSCYPNAATWFLVAILFLSINLSISYFADIALDQQVSVTSCDDPRIDRTFNCFNSSTLVYIDCINNTNVELIHCFRFYRFGVDVDLIQTLATSYAFYLVITSIFTHLFLVMKVLLRISHKVLWGVVILLVGMVLFLLTLVLAAIWITGYASPVRGELSRINVIHLAQFGMVSWFVILIGLLMLVATWAEKKDIVGKKKPSCSSQPVAETENL